MITPTPYVYKDKRNLKSTGNYSCRASLTKAIKAFHVEGFDMVQISARVGVSRTTVGRLLKDKDNAPPMAPIHQDGAGKVLNKLLNSLWRIQPSTSIVPSGHFAVEQPK
jgi:hypothetical protein